MLSKKDIVKGAIKMTAQFGLMNVGLRVADAYTERRCGFLLKTAMRIGVILLGFAVGDSAAEYTFDYVGRIVDALEDDEVSVVDTVVKN